MAFKFKRYNYTSETNSAIAKGHEDDSAKIFGKFNSVKWINDKLKFKSTFYSRRTKADYDGSATDEKGYVSDTQSTFNLVLNINLKILKIINISLS